MELPKISIVTPSYNQGQYIEETICSVLDQNYPNLEYIIIDGGSTDNTLEAIERYKSHLTYWVSEPDLGQSHAINKGLKRCTGDVFNWLNSDDLLTKGSLDAIADTFMKNAGSHCVIGDIQLFGNVEKLYDRPVKRKTTHDTLRHIVIKQPSTFYSLQAINKMGYVNEGLDYIMDFEWFIRFLLTHPIDAIMEIDETIAKFRMHDESKTGINIDKFEAQKIQFWSAIHSWLCNAQQELDITFDRNIYSNDLVPNIVSDFFFKQAVIAYGEKDINKVKEFLLRVTPQQLDTSQQQEFKRIKTRVKLIPSLFFKNR